MKIFCDLNFRNLMSRNVVNTIFLIVGFAIVAVVPTLAFGSVETSLEAVQAKLVSRILPLTAIVGLIIAGISFAVGHANARQHLFFAILGAVVGFGAESIISFIRALIH